MEILKAEHIEKHFGSVSVLKDISFSLQEGQALSVIGSSGSGKTTLLRCLNFLETPDHGRISVRDKVLFDANDAETQREADIRKKRLHFGLVFQNFNLFPQYTALENVTLARELMAKKDGSGEAVEAIREEGVELLKKMGLADRMNNYPHQLSGGQQQRVAIARALAMKPDILCFDEPTSALDPELTGEVLKVIRQLAEHDTTMIIVTHEMAFARDVADQVIFMDGGVIVEQGEAAQVIDHPQEERTRQFLSRYASGEI
ncbi:MAG: amino acid ABC transporter ATP-binding protein [Oscillospiraceae bacterium]|nr:amino acid ABC transporter ATP-binding protein [Oscillospiraceae bacterium]